MRIEMMHPAEQLVSVMNRLYTSGLTTMTGANLSIREANGDIWATPGGIDKGSISHNDIVCIHPDGRQSGHRKPTSELLIHQTAYESCGDIKAILHAHSPALTTFSIMKRVPTLNLNPNTRLVCGKVGLAPYARTGSQELADALAAEFLNGYPVVLMENHGVSVAAETIGQAYMIFETLEFMARSELLANRLGPLRILTDDQIDLARTKNHTRLTEFKPRSHSSEELAMRRDMTRIIHRALDQQLFTSSQGTLSVCLSDGSFLITPFGADRRSIHEEELVLVRRSMKEEGKSPSRAVFLHELIYHHQPEIQAIICAQPPNLMAFTLTNTCLDTHFLDESYLLLNQLPVVPYGLNYTDPKKTMSLFSRQTPAVLLENDGIITTGQSLLQAFDRFEAAEFIARAQLAAPQRTDLMQLDPDRLAELDKSFA